MDLFGDVQNPAATSTGFDLSGDLASQEQERMIAAAREQERNFWPGLARTAASGALLNWADEAEGSIRSLLDPTTTYEQARDESRASKEMFEQGQPGLGLAAEGGGILGTAAMAGPKAFAGMTESIPNWMKLSALGATGAGVEAAGAASGRPTLEGMALPVLTGAALGPAVPWALGGAVRGIKGGLDTLGDTLRTQKTRAERKMTQVLRDDYMTADQLDAEIRRLGPEANIADVGGKNTRALGRAVIDQPGPGTNLAMKRLAERQIQQQGRIDTALSATTGTNEHYYAFTKDLVEKRRLAAAPAYEAAHAVDIEMTSQLENILKRPSTKKAWKQAKDLAAEQDIQLPEVYQFDEMGNPTEIIEVPDMQSWDWIKQGLDAVVDTETSALGRMSPKGRAVTMTKRELLNALDDVNPAYKAARKEFSDSMSVENAAELGRKILRDDYEISLGAVRKMSDAEREAYTIGAVKTIRDKIMASGDTHDATKKILNNNLIKERLKPAFPTNKDYADFITALKKEETFSSTFNKMRGGSQTSGNLAAGEDLGIDTISTLGAALGGNPVAMGRAVGKLLKKSKIPEELIEGLSQQLFDPIQAPQVIAMLRKKGTAPSVIRKLRDISNEAIKATTAITAGAAIGDAE